MVRRMGQQCRATHSTSSVAATRLEVGPSRESSHIEPQLDSSQAAAQCGSTLGSGRLLAESRQHYSCCVLHGIVAPCVAPSVVLTLSVVPSVIALCVVLAPWVVLCVMLCEL